MTNAQTLIAEPQWIGTRRTGRPAWYQAGHLSYLGATAAAKRLGTNRKTFYRWVEQYPEDLQSITIQGSTYYLTTVLDDFIRKHRTVSPDPRGRKLVSRTMPLRPRTDDGAPD